MAHDTHQDTHQDTRHRIRDVFHRGDHRDHDGDHAGGARGRHEAPAPHVSHEDRRALGEGHARDRFGGVNGGAAFFGWLVAIALTVLLTSIVGAIAAAVGSSTNFSQDDAQREAGAIGLGVGIGFLVVMAIAYYAGGYVAGRMSRFDGARQGFAVWAIGLLVTLLAVGAGWAFGSQYNILDRVDLPRFPIPTDAATISGIVAAAVLLLVTLLAAMVGGKVGHRYHNKVDQAAWF